MFTVEQWRGVGREFSDRMVIKTMTSDVMALVGTVSCAALPDPGCPLSWDPCTRSPWSVHPSTSALRPPEWWTRSSLPAFLKNHSLGNTSFSGNVGLMLDQRLRRWSNLNPTLAHVGISFIYTAGRKLVDGTIIISCKYAGRRIFHLRDYFLWGTSMPEIYLQTRS